MDKKCKKGDFALIESPMVNKKDDDLNFILGMCVGKDKSSEDYFDFFTGESFTIVIHVSKFKVIELSQENLDNANKLKLSWVDKQTKLKRLKKHKIFNSNDDAMLQFDKHYNYFLLNKRTRKKQEK